MHYKFTPGLAITKLSDDINAITGTYSNVIQYKDYDSITLWHALTKKANTSFKKYDSTDANQSIRLNTVSKKLIKLELIRNDSIIGSHSLKGKFKDSAFYAKKRRYYFGVPPIFVMSAGYKIMLAQGSNGSLLLDLQQHKFGWIILLHAGSTQPFNIRYEKAK